jgi:mycothiol synthase
VPFDEWWEMRRDNDHSVWFVVRDGDEIAAVARNEARESAGYVGLLGVRRPWRGRGLGKALLYRTFAEFWERGLTRVTLGVDSESPTGATKLYERVGMHVESENVVFEKMLE